MSASLGQLSPEAVLQKWLFLGADGSTRIQELFDGLFGRVARAATPDKTDAKQP
jgi:hypothetical protein